MEEMIRSILERDGFAQTLLDCDDPQQARALLEEAGLALSTEEIRIIGRGLRNALCDADELGEDALDSVAGGLAALDAAATAVSVLSALAERMPAAGRGYMHW